MTEAVQVEFEEIKAGDIIRTVRKVGNLTQTIEGEVLDQDIDGDWLNDGDLITYHDEYEETYFRLPVVLPTEPGSLVVYPGDNGNVFALKLYGDEGWFLSFADGSSGLFSDVTVANKDWTLVR